MSRIRTLDFLPSIFQTETNSQFLGATLDQLVNPPVTKKIQGYVGSKFGYGIDAKDYYVTEPNKVRRDYQLEPGVTFLKDNETTAYDFISYPGILDSLKMQGAIVNNNDSLFNSQFYSWDSFTNLDMIINYNQYYWLPEGPPAVTVAASTVFTENQYVVTPLPSAYNIRAVGSGVGTNNPTITLLRGGRYSFLVNQDTQFWIQGAPGVTGYSPVQTNLYTRDIYGVSNNGASEGAVVFDVPQKDAQNEFNYPGNNTVGVISTRPFSEINGARLSDISSIDGVTALNGRTVMFYNTGIPNETGYVSAFYGVNPYDQNTVTARYPNGYNGIETVTATEINTLGQLIVSDAANLVVGNTLTFSGTSFGDIQPYDPDTANAISASSMTVGKKYFIAELGETDWIDAGVAKNAVLDAEIVGNELRVYNTVSGAFSIGNTLNGAGVINGTIITGYDLVASANNGVPTYTVNNTQTVARDNIDVYGIQLGKIFTCANNPSTTGLVVEYDPTIYYIKSVDTGTNTITISQSLNGPTFQPSANGSGNMTVYINQGQFEEGYYTDVNNYFYTISFVGDRADPVLQLNPAGLIPIEQKITPQYGTEYIGLHFVKDVSGVIQQLPYISAPLDTLYYQDGTNPNRVGVIKLIENNETNTIDVTNDILGKTSYTSKNGVVFTNGLKVAFDGDVIPRSYLQGEYYVAGVGTAIELIPVESLSVPEPFTALTSNPYDILPYDDGTFDATLNIPATPDYITIARNSINKNAWSRSNRWFHIDVIQSTADYNNNPSILDEFAVPDNKAKRPILEFYPNLKLFNSGIIGKAGVDFIDTRTTDAFGDVENQQNYYPDVETYTTYQGTINANDLEVGLADLLVDQYYQITDLGDTSTNTWQELGSELEQDGGFEIGVEYIITTVGTGTDWELITGTAGPFVQGYVFTAEHPGDGTGTGAALKTLFLALEGGATSSNALEAGRSYTILSLGTTQWQLIGASLTPYVGEIFTATGSAFGTGTAIQGSGQVLPKTVTTISIPANQVTGTFGQGQWINDLILGEQSKLPTGTRILSIENTSPNYEMTVYWPIPGEVSEAGSASFVACSSDNTDQLLYPGARVVFAADENELVRNKIYNVNFNVTGSETYPVITLTEAEDGLVIESDMFSVNRGFNNRGKTFYFDGVDYVQAQQKQTINQAPLFDIFDKNGISYGDTTVYNSSSFDGSKLFNYKIGVGVNDAILGFPISYSSINNVGDISFEVSLYTQTFNYIDNGNSITSYINDGFVYNYQTRDEYERLIGWQTAVAPSTQYQIFEFKYIPSDPEAVWPVGQSLDYTFTVNVPQLSVDETVWPSLEVYNNNDILALGTDYTVVNTDTSTIITVKLSSNVETPIQVAILSDKTSQDAYYSIPINLSNNPFNSNPTSVDIGDIRGHYQTIYENNPDTTGVMFGPNNYRDLGNLVPWGNRIIQNSASLVLPGAFLRDPRHNLYDSLLFNSREYIKFKTLLVDTTDKLDIQQKYDPSEVLDLALDVITSVKSQEQPFFWSDMIPNKAPYITNMYNFANQAAVSVFPLSKIYDFTSANYDGVLVYLQRKIGTVTVTRQLFKNSEYVISTDSPSVTVTTFLESGDKIIVKEYNQTYGSYIPNTPSKLGLYPLFVPAVVLDDTYNEPTYFIQGHDGSYNKLYGEYNANLGMLVDFRDQVLLEFETRVYNNIKLDRTLPIDTAEIIPGFFRDTALTYAEWTDIYSTNFLDWVGQNRLNYKLQLFNTNDPWSYNYREQCTLKLDGSKVLQGYWRGIYEYLYDTSTPNLTPWAMIGYANKPSWWEARYGAAPYTSDNLILWTDLQDGIDYNDGTPVVRPLYQRPGLLDIIPVDDQGNLREPIDAVIANYNTMTFKRDWRVGDDAPVEYSYRKSSTYPFDLMRLEALLKPAAFYNLGADLDNYKYNFEFNQFLVNDRTHLIPADIEIYGNGTAKTSYINWIVDYEKQLGVDATTNIKRLLTNLDVRLVYRLAGFSDKTLLKFFVEKGTPESRNSSLLIPDESYQILLYQNQAMTKLVYSGVVVQKMIDGYAVFGNSQTSAYFKTLRPILNGPKSRITVQDLSVQVADNYSTTEELVPYGTVFYTPQELCQFLVNYGKWLELNGAVFDDQIQNIPVTWSQMCAEFLYWAQTGWVDGSICTLNPSATKLTIDKESQVVQPLTYNQSNFVLNNNLYPIQNKDLSIFRDGTRFSVTPLNEGDAVAYGQFNLSNIEHGIVFQNETLFNDTIYNLISGLKQNRIYVRGTKSGEWNGTLFASGFIYNQDNILEWNPELKYTKGAIVKYKNKFFTALKIVQPSQKFKEDEWKVTDYDEIQKGLLPNSSTRSYESALYYNTDTANLESDADLLSFSLIGFRPREYMASADLTDITQVNVYKNLIKEKGTLNAVKAFKGANLPQGGIDYDVYENWAILQGTFGGTLNDNFVQFRLNESNITANPSIVGITDGNDVQGAQQLVPLYKLFNYGRPITDPNVLPTADSESTTKLFSDAGYVNTDDVKMSAYFFSNLPTAVDKNREIVPITNLYVGDYVWLADYQASWQVLTPTSIGQVVLVRNNINGTCVVYFDKEHNLNKFDIFSIVNFDSAVNGYYVVADVVNTKQVLVTLTLPNGTKSISGLGIGMTFASKRVAQPGDIESTDLIDNEFVKNTVWVDEGTNGEWAVYRKNINYKYKDEFTQPSGQKFGSSVAYSTLSDYLLGDAAEGKVYRYQYDVTDDDYDIDEILTGLESFGTAIVHEQNVYAISQPNNTPRVYLYTVNDTKVTDNIIPYQVITASNIDPSITSFGDAMALSGDLNWLFISDYDEVGPRNNVQVYRRKDEIITITDGVPSTPLVNGATYQIETVGNVNWTDLCADTIANEKDIYFVYDDTPVTGTGVARRCDYQFVATITNNAVTIDKFGHSLSTNYYGTTLVVGAPNRDQLATNNGKGYIYTRLVQNYEIQDEYVIGEPIDFTLAWAPNIGIPLTVTKNGVEVDPSDYSFVGTTFTYSGVYQIGDILTVGGNQFLLSQELDNTINPRNGTQFGYSVDNNTLATEILVGAPFYLSSRNQEGAAFRYTYGGARFGIISGTTNVNVTATRQVLINGYLVNILAGTASQAATNINNAGITNVRAADVDGKLVISLINFDLALSSQELILAADTTTLNELGITLYTQTQVIQDPHASGPSQFGTTIKFNEHNNVAISAPVDTRFTQTTFDFVDDENYQNDTIFDNNSTQFIDTFRNAGAVYTFEYLGNYNESLMNIGNYTYAQSVNAQNLSYGSQPRYGLALDWNEDKIIIGSPDYRPEDVDGQVVIYTNDTGENNWIVHRQPNPTVDINRVYNVQLFSGETNQTLQNLDYIDPLQGKLLGAVQQNIDVISNVDPANYNNINNPESMVWGEAQLGTIWFDTSNVRYLNYHQDTNSYNARYWGTLFPGSDVAVYSWVASNVLPSAYQGPGLPKDITNYTVQTVLNSSNTITPVYYFWVRNSGIVFSNKSLADTNIANYIASPVSSGVSYMAPINTDAVALYNVKQYINANDTIYQMGFSAGQQDNPAHQEFTLIRSDYADDFLPGVPGTRGYVTPESLYDRLLDSLAGVDESGAVVPNPFLPKAVQSGVLARPRQSFFYNRYLAIQNYLQYANTVMALYPIAEIRTFNFLNEQGTYFDTQNYWEYINWWAVGYDNNTKSVLQVPIYADLSALEVAVGTIVTVAQNSNGSAETYIYEDGGVWTRIGLQNGTIRFKDELFDYDAAGFGFGGTFYDTDSFDVFPSEETRWIIRALNEQIYTNELLIYRNKSLILLFEYIQEETVENQNYLPWLNKTSLVDVEHKVRELVPLQNFVSDNEQFLEGYVNETKPYHVVIKEFLFDYKGGDVYPGTLTDFDLPATYDSTIDKFVSPQLVYQNASTDYEFLPDSPIWSLDQYTEWYNNYGLNLEGQLNYQIAKLDSFVTLVSQNILVDNPQGFPINGTMIIGTEKISYSSVDRNTGIISGLTRGVDGTEVVDHLPGELIYMDLPGVLLLDGGRNYANPPRVIAQIDTTVYPAPRQEAVLEAVMSLDTVVAINVINPGEGYVVQPEIIIDPSDTFSFDSANVNLVNNTIDVYAPVLETGDLVRYVTSGTNVGGLADRQYYYINVLSSSPTTILALYTTYADALNDNNRVTFLSQGTGVQNFEYGARAVPVTSSYPIRENNITLRFDRTTYNSQVTDWAPNTFYGSEFVSYTLESASSPISLASIQPDINTVLSSAQGTVFPLVTVSNDREIDWSSFERTVGSITSDNQLVLSYPSVGLDENPSGSTIGFYVGMPVKFAGDTGTEIVAGDTYYINEIIGLDRFKISETPSGTALSLAPIPDANFAMFTAEVIDTAVITSIYSGYRTVTSTTATNNVVNVSITDIGTNGTNGFYTNLPVFFTGDALGGLEINKVYYVVSVLGNEEFTLSETMDPITVKVLQTNAANQIIVQNSSELNVNDPIVFDSMNVDGEGSDTFGNIEKQKIYYVKTIGINVITISETIGGTTFVTGVVAPSDETYCYITSQTGTKTLTNDTGNATLVVGLPVSPGQVDGQAFTFYPSSQNYADINASDFTYGNILTKTIAETLSGDNLIAINDNNTGLYTNIPFTVASNIGGLITTKTYYAYDINNIEIVCKSTTSSTLDFNAEFLNDEMEITVITDGTGNIYPGTLISGANVQLNTYVLGQIFDSVNAGSFVAGKGYTITALGDTDWDAISNPGSRSWASFESPVIGDWFYATGVGSGTGTADLGIEGKVGVYQISREYPVPVSVVDGSAATGIITVSNGFDTDVLYENMPIVFSLQSLGGVLLDSKYYVRHIIDSTRFTISVVEGDSSSVFTVASGIMEATGTVALKAYLPMGELISGDDYEIKTVGTTDWQSLGATYVAFGDASVVAGNYYIIKDTNLFTDSFWTTVTGVTQNNVQTNDILYAVNSATMTSTQEGTAYLLGFTYNGASQSGTGEATVVLANQAGPVQWTQEITEDPVFDVGYILGGYNVIINDGGTGFTQNNTITIPGTALGGTTPDNDLTITVSRIDSIVPGAYSWSLPVESNGSITKVIASGTPPGIARNYYLKVTGSNSFKVYSDPLMQLPVSGIDFPYQGFTTTTITNVASTVITLDDASGFSPNDPIVFNNLDVLLQLVDGQTYYVLTVSGNDITVGINPSVDPLVDAINVYPSGSISFTNGPVATKPGSMMLLPEPFIFDPSIVRYNNRVWVCTVSNNDDQFLFGKWQELRSDDRRLNALDRVVGYYQPTVNMPGMDLTQLFTGLTYPNATYKGNAFEPDQQYPIDTQLVDQPFYPTQVNIPAIEWNGTNYIAPANLPNYAAVVADIEIQDQWLLSTLANQTLSLTDIVRGDDGTFVMTSMNKPTPLFKSADQTTWSVNGFFVPRGTLASQVDFLKTRLIASGLQFNAITYKNGAYWAVGKNIVTSTDTTMWYEKFVFPGGVTAGREIYDIAVIDSDAFTGRIAVGVNLGQALILVNLESIDDPNNTIWTRISGLNNRILTGITYAFGKIFVVGKNGGILTSTDGFTWTQLSESIAGTYNYNAIKFADDTLVIVGDEGIVLITTDGENFSLVPTDTSENLNNLTYVADRNQWTIVGNNNTVLQTYDITNNILVTWDTTSIFSTPEPEYTVKGDPFQAGYGPEELVPGIVSDQLTMIVNTRAGTNWPATEYAHVGYNVVSTLYDLDAATNEYSFDNIVQDPAQIAVFLVDNGTSETLYDVTDYTVDWINKSVSLINPLLVVGDQLRVDVYEVGNGDQLVKSSNHDEPMQLNEVTGFTEIVLDCDYNTVGYNTNGIVIPETSGELYAEPAVYHNGTLLKSGLTNTILFTSGSTHALTTYSTTGLAVDQPIVFSDDIFGGITPKTTYYIYQILNATDFLIRDSAGDPVYLTNGQGSAVFVTYDYAVAVADNQVNAKVIFAENYLAAIDYISYSFFGPTAPQYGYTIPVTQTFAGQASVGPYTLTNSLNGDNPENAIVEVDGLRVSPSEYTISFAHSTITFDTAKPTTSTIAVTTFNDTQRQYLFTSEYDTASKQVSPIQNVNNTITLSEPTVRITTTIPHNLETNDIVRIDGCLGAEQLNDHPVFIVEKVDDYTVKIFDYIEGIPLSASGPVNIVDAYLGGGYIWKAYSWILDNKFTTQTLDNRFIVSQVKGLVAETPVYFTEDGKEPGDTLTVPQLIYGEKYYIKEVDEFTNTFTITDIRNGSELVLSNVSGLNIRVTQWEQTNVDRLWVTVNGRRLSSDNLRLNVANEVSILTEVLPGDQVVITSMMPSASPDAMTYIQIVDANGQGTVYRANSETNTWLTKPVGEFADTIEVADVTRLTNVITQTSTTPVATLGYHVVGLEADRYDIAQVRVYNNNPARLGYIDADYTELRVTGLGPSIAIQEGVWIQAGDILTITTLEGRTLYVNGEYMTILSVDEAINLIQVQRGAQGSIVNTYIPAHTTVYGLLEQNRMSEINYNDTWNKIPGIYNEADGDPLQIAESTAARFLRTDIS